MNECIWVNKKNENYDNNRNDSNDNYDNNNKTVVKRLTFYWYY